MTQHLSVRVKDELMEKLEECADIMKLKVSDITRWILTKHIEAELEGLRKLNDKEYK